MLFCLRWFVRIPPSNEIPSHCHSVLTYAGESYCFTVLIPTHGPVSLLRSWWLLSWLFTIWLHVWGSVDFFARHRCPADGPIGRTSHARLNEANPLPAIPTRLDHMNVLAILQFQVRVLKPFPPGYVESLPSSFPLDWAANAASLGAGSKSDISREWLLFWYECSIRLPNLFAVQFLAISFRSRVSATRQAVLTSLLCGISQSLQPCKCLQVGLISGSYGDKYEDGCLLGCSTIYCGIHWQTFQHTDDGVSKVSWNVGRYRPDYTVLHPIRQPYFAFKWATTAPFLSFQLIIYQSTAL
jgi:hypothetical protein